MASLTKEVYVFKPDRQDIPWDARGLVPMWIVARWASPVGYYVAAGFPTHAEAIGWADRYVRSLTS